MIDRKTRVAIMAKTEVTTDIPEHRDLNAAFRADVDAAYRAAMAAGLFKNTYAATNADEYWAEGVQDWFDANQTSTPANGIHNEIGTRDQLKRYDPALAGLLGKVYADDDWRWKAAKR